MTTSEFLNALRARPNLPLAFSTESGAVPSGYHLTEIKRVTHDTFDCGDMAHHWTETHFELWTPPAPGQDRPPMLASKFLAIVDKVRGSLGLDGTVEALVFGRIGGGADQLHRITSVESGKESADVRLEPVSASCKAADRGTEAVDSTAGCCGTADTSAAAVPEETVGCRKGRARGAGKETRSTGGCCGIAGIPIEAPVKSTSGCCIASKPTVPSDSDVFGYRKTDTGWFTEFESHGIRFSF